MPIQTPVSSRTALWLGAATCLALASPAFAQQATPAMRYLSWVGKSEAAPVPSAPRVQPVADGRYPSIGSLGGRPSRYSPSVASGALTPANAWYGPQAPGPALPPPAYAAQPQPGPAPSFAQPFAAPPAFAPQAYPQQGYPQQASPQPVAVPQTAMSAAPVYVQPNYSAQPMPGPHYQQQQRQLQQAQETPGPAWSQPGYTPQVYAPAESQQSQPQAPHQTSTPATVTGPGWASPQPTLAGAPVADPMAPRRDAPIFSIAGAHPQSPAVVPLQQGQVPGRPEGQAPSQGQLQGQQTASVEGPPRSGPRYYSVHRAAGHQPDPTAMPESVYAVIPEGAFLDAARTDLAEPPPPPVQTRTINGRVQAINQGDNPSLP